MKRTYFLIIIGILILPMNTLANPFSFYLTPKISMNYSSSKALRDYNDCNAVFMYGGEAKILHHSYHIGLYFQYQQYSFKIDDSNYTSDSFKEKGSRFSFGLIKEQRLRMLSIYAKIGMTFYSDKLGFLEEDKKREGIQLGVK